MTSPLTERSCRLEIIRDPQGLGDAFELYPEWIIMPGSFMAAVLHFRTDQTLVIEDI